MPEGDTVWLACRRLDEALAGAEVVKSDFRVPQHATADLAGEKVLEVVSRGKHQLFRFSGGLTLHTHLRMDGSWHVYRPGSPRRGGPDHQVRVVLTTAEREAVGFRLPVVELVPTSEEDRVVGHLGPDLLGPHWNPDEALHRLTADPARTIGEALLDQRNLAGIGTLYRSETLFLSGVHPRRPVGEVANLPAVIARAKKLLTANSLHPEQTTTGDTRRGRQHYVFERARQPCRRCGTPIRDEEFGPRGKERRSYWCPSCQPL